jgi:apolipoprotein N-acyltransferase
LRIGPLICWESAFGDLAFDEIQHGAQVLVVATDDAWFGTSSGPYQHAQIAQMRAIESGSYVIRAAATGISGIVAPDGSWQTQLGLERKGIVYGTVDKPAPTIFSRIGPTRIFLAVAVFYLLTLLRRGRR